MINHRNVEKYGPLWVALLFTILFIILKVSYNFSVDTLLSQDYYISFLSVSVSLGAIWAGFLGVITGMISVLPKGRLLTSLKNSGYINDLYHYLKYSLFASIIFSVVSMLGFFLIRHPDIGYYYFCLWLFVGIYSALAFLRIVNIMFSVMLNRTGFVGDSIF